MTLKGIAFSVAKGIGKIVLLLLLLFVTLGAYTWYKERPIRKFCDNISATATPGSILADAQAEGFLTHDNMAQRGEVLIVNQRSPFWRFACVVTFKGGKIADKKVITAD